MLFKYALFAKTMPLIGKSLYGYQNIYNLAIPLRKLSSKKDYSDNKLNGVISYEEASQDPKRILPVLYNKAAVSYGDAARAKAAIEDNLLKDPNVVSICTVDELNADGHKTGNCVVEVGVISSENHTIMDQYLLPQADGNYMYVRILVKEAGIIKALSNEELSKYNFVAKFWNKCKKEERNKKPLSDYAEAYVKVKKDIREGKIEEKFVEIPPDEFKQILRDMQQILEDEKVRRKKYGPSY